MHIQIDIQAAILCFIFILCRGLYRGAGLQLMEHALNYGDGQLDIPDELGDDALKVLNL